MLKPVMDPYRRKILVSFAVSFVLSLTAFCLLFFLRAPYSLRLAADSFFISAAVGFGVLGMIFVERSGTFDVVNYGFYRLFESFRLDRKKKWDNAGDYKEEKQKKRHASKAAYWPCLAVSGFFLTMAILFTILYFAL